MTIVEFLLARIAEDGSVASGANDHDRWRSGDVDGYPLVFMTDVAEQRWRVAEAVNPGTAEHIARHDPIRVLAECEAKRAIVRAATLWMEDEPATHSERAFLQAYTDTLRAIAAVYADHPDYDQAWALDERAS